MARLIGKENGFGCECNRPSQIDQWFPTFYSPRTPLDMLNIFRDPHAHLSPTMVGAEARFFLGYATSKRPEMALWDL